MVKNRILLFCMPAPSHTKGIISSAKELSKGNELIIILEEKYEKDFSSIKAEKIFYPKNNFKYFSSGPKELLERMHQAQELIPFSEKVIESKKPDLVIFDTNAIWAGIAAQNKGLKTLSYALSYTESKKLPLLPYGRKKIFLKHAWNNLIEGKKYSKEIFSSLKKLSHLSKKKLKLNDIIEFHGDKHLVFGLKKFYSKKQNYYFIGRKISIPEKKKEGLIYISLGTLFNKDPELIRNLIEHIQKISNKNIIVSAGEAAEKLKDLESKKIQIKKHLNQIEVLSRAKIFITHGGSNSIYEALQTETAMLVLPQANDQFSFSAKLRKYMYAKIFNSYSEITKKDLSHKYYIQQKKHNEKLCQNLKKTLSNKLFAKFVLKIIDKNSD